MLKMLVKHKVFLLVFLFLLAFFLLSFTSLLRESLTYDEIVYLQGGRNAVLYHNFTIDPYNPPLAQEISIVPYIFIKGFYTNTSFALENPVFGRIMMLFLACCLLLGIFFITEKYFGLKSAFLGLFLTTFEPTILGNSHYIATDVGLTLFFFLSYFFFLEYIKSKKYILQLAVCIGFGLGEKITFIPFFLFSCLLLLVFLYKKKTFHFFVKNIKQIGGGVVVSLFILWSVFLFHQSVVIKPGVGTERVSQKVLAYAAAHHNTLLKDVIYFGENAQIPLGDFLAELKNNLLRTTETGQCFFLGKFYTFCRWYFMPINLILKIPIPLLVLFSISLFNYVKNKKRRKECMYFFIPIFVVLFFSILLKMAPWVRYDLPLYPFLIVMSASSFPFWEKTIKRKIFLILLLFWYVVGTLASFPHFISFANELTFGQKQFILMDSNIDWGQSLLDVRAYITKNKLGTARFSYFGRDNGDEFGLQSDKAYGGFKTPDICEFHTIHAYPTVQQATLISITNWYICGYSTNPLYAKKKIKATVGESIFVF